MTVLSSSHYSVRLYSLVCADLPTIQTLLVIVDGEKKSCVITSPPDLTVSDQKLDGTIIPFNISYIEYV